MRALLVLLGTMLMLASCAKEVQLVETASTKEPVSFEEKAVMELRLSQNDLARYSDRDKGVWLEARTAGLKKVFNTVLNRNIIFVPLDGFERSGALGTYAQSGALVSGDAETGDIVQSFVTTVRFSADRNIGGQIVTLNEDKYVSGMLDSSYGMLFSSNPVSLPAYVAIGQPADEIGKGFYRLIGVAEVKQILDHKVQLPEEQGGVTGKLCSLETIMSNREVEKGDIIFLLSVDVAALAPEIAPGVAEADLQTVVVKPAVVDKVKEPAEQK